VERPTVLSAFVVDPKRIGGVEMFCRELSIQLDSRGWNNVLCFTAEPPDNVRRHLTLPNVSIEVDSTFGRRDWGSTHEFSRVLSKHRPRILHLHFTPHVSQYAWLARFHRVRSIYLTDYLSRVEGQTAERTSFLRRAIARAANWPLTNLIAISGFTARECSAAGLASSRKIIRIYSGVDLSRVDGSAAAFRAKYGIPEGRRLVVQVSWIIPEKGIADFLEAARLVLQTDPDVHFVLAGDGALREKLSRETSQSAWAGHFTWTGLLEDPLLDGVYAAADVVCQLSRWEEAFGWTNVEAMACGKPLVATAVGAIPEIVEDGVTGFLVQRRHPADAADRILRLLRDNDLRERMGTNARQAVAEKFDLHANVTELVGLYTSGQGNSL
jgi:glycosyltransferase involved in cell wall biosynthesis